MESILDNDLYKFTMMRAVWERYPEVEVAYEFINRGEGKGFNAVFYHRFLEAIGALGERTLREEEFVWLQSLGLFSESFLNYLKRFRFQPEAIHAELTGEEALKIKIEGRWLDTILLEVPLMALISEIYFETVETDWEKSLDRTFEKAREKGMRLLEAGCRFSDFGTRRRRSLAVQKTVLEAFKGLPEALEGAFLGTSNPHLARLYGLEPIGTMAHEWIMGHAGLFGIAGANGRALRTWKEIYGEKLLIALTDTYTTDLFLKEFSGELARQYAGVRHDSGSPKGFTDKMAAFYRAGNLDPREKTAVFSDGLDVDRAIEIQNYAAGKIQPVFGIGTHFSNDFEGSPALNMVIKMFSINGRPVAKISDAPGKASGAPRAVKDSLLAIEQALRADRGGVRNADISELP